MIGFSSQKHQNRSNATLPNCKFPSLILSQVSDDLEARQQSKEMARPPILRGLSKRSKAPKQFCDGCDEAAADIDLLSKDVDTDFDDVCFLHIVNAQIRIESTSKTFFHQPFNTFQNTQ